MESKNKLTPQFKNTKTPLNYYQYDVCACVFVGICANGVLQRFPATPAIFTILFGANSGSEMTNGYFKTNNAMQIHTQKYRQHGVSC